jgi:hypothetical protein
MEKRPPLSHPLSQMEGLRHIENYYRSGLRPSEYYHQHGISEWQFYNWRRRYLASHPHQETSSSPAKKFQPIVIDSPANMGLSVSGLEIHYPHGVRVVVNHPIDIDKLLALIKLRV